MLFLSGDSSLIADCRAEQPTQTGVPIATLDHYAHYYPFGMMQPGRNGNRYRFGGMEKDDEVKATKDLMDIGEFETEQELYDFFLLKISRQR